MAVALFFIQGLLIFLILLSLLSLETAWLIKLNLKLAIGIWVRHPSHLLLLKDRRWSLCIPKSEFFPWIWGTVVFPLSAFHVSIFMLSEHSAGGWKVLHFPGGRTFPRKWTWWIIRKARKYAIITLWSLPLESLMLAYRRINASNILSNICWFALKAACFIVEVLLSPSTSSNNIWCKIITAVW